MNLTKSSAWIQKLLVAVIAILYLANVLTSFSKIMSSKAHG